MRRELLCGFSAAANGSIACGIRKGSVCHGPGARVQQGVLIPRAPEELAPAPCVGANPTPRGLSTPAAFSL